MTRLKNFVVTADVIEEAYDQLTKEINSFAEENNLIIERVHYDRYSTGYSKHMTAVVLFSGILAEGIL